MESLEHAEGFGAAARAAGSVLAAAHGPWIPWMRRALAAARSAAAAGEVPVGAVVVRGSELLAEASNRTVALCDPSGHAELLALRRAAALERNHRLPGAALVTTLEPCLMCFGALLETRIETLVIGASDSLRGAAGLWKSGQLERYPVKDLRLVEGVAEAECRELLETWFASRREGA